MAPPPRDLPKGTLDPANYRRRVGTQTSIIEYLKLTAARLGFIKDTGIRNAGHDHITAANPAPVDQDYGLLVTVEPTTMTYTDAVTAQTFTDIVYPSHFYIEGDLTDVSVSEGRVIGYREVEEDAEDV